MKLLIVDSELDRKKTALLTADEQGNVYVSNTAKGLFAIMDKKTARELAFKSRPPQTKEVEFEGTKFILKRPNVGDKGNLVFSAGKTEGGKFTIDPVKFQVNALITCLHMRNDDGSVGEPVFELADYDQLVASESGSLADVLGPLAGNFVHGEDAKKEKADAKNA